MNKVVSLVEALTPRAQRVAALLSRRLAFAGLWEGYTEDEPLVGELVLENFLSFHRRGAPKAKMSFWDPAMTDLKEVQWGKPIVLEANIDQRIRSHITLNQPGEIAQTLSATFTKTRTLQEQVKAGFEAAIKTGAQVGSSVGIDAKATVELSLKLYAEYQRQWGEVATTSDTITTAYKRMVSPDELRDGPIMVEYEGIRSMNREQRVVRSAGDYEHGVHLIDETGAGVNPPRIDLALPSWASFLNVVQGFAPKEMKEETGGGTFIRPTAFYDAFISDPIRGDALESLKAPAEGAVELLVNYDNVLSQDIKIL